MTTAVSTRSVYVVRHVAVHDLLCHAQYDITPRYEFGFGLSYTTFEYENLYVSAVPQYDTSYEEYEALWAAGQPTPYGEGSSVAIWLHRPAFQVQFEVTNTGSVAGAEVRPSSVFMHARIVR